MSSPDTDATPLADVLAERGRPVTPDGIRRARQTRAERAARRDPAANTALLDRLRAA